MRNRYHCSVAQIMSKNIKQTLVCGRIHAASASATCYRLVSFIYLEDASSKTTIFLFCRMTRAIQRSWRYGKIGPCIETKFYVHVPLQQKIGFRQQQWWCRALILVCWQLGAYRSILTHPISAHPLAHWNNQERDCPAAKRTARRDPGIQCWNWR